MPVTFLGEWTYFYAGGWDYWVAEGPENSTHHYQGNDWDASSVVIGNAGTDIIFAGGGDDIVASGAGNDSLSGGQGDDSVYAGAGDDTIALSQGNDDIDGGTGTDTIVLSDAEGKGWAINLGLGSAVQLVGNALNTASFVNVEHVSGSSENDVIIGDETANVLRSGTFDFLEDDDLLYGYGGDDTLILVGGSDEAHGGAGNDRLVVEGAHIGHHILNGGNGADTFVLDQEAGQEGAFATIQDFRRASGDKIEIDGKFLLDWSGGTYAGFEGHASVWAFHTATGATLHFDHDGDRLSDQSVEIVTPEGLGGAGFSLWADLDFF